MYLIKLVGIHLYDIIRSIIQYYTIIALVLQY